MSLVGTYATQDVRKSRVKQNLTSNLSLGFDRSKHSTVNKEAYSYNGQEKLVYHNYNQTHVQLGRSRSVNKTTNRTDYTPKKVEYSRVQSKALKNQHSIIIGNQKQETFINQNSQQAQPYQRVRMQRNQSQVVLGSDKEELVSQSKVSYTNQNRSNTQLLRPIDSMQFGSFPRQFDKSSTLIGDFRYSSPEVAQINKRGSNINMWGKLSERDYKSTMHLAHKSLPGVNNFEKISKIDQSNVPLGNSNALFPQREQVILQAQTGQWKECMSNQQNGRLCHINFGTKGQPIESTSRLYYKRHETTSPEYIKHNNKTNFSMKDNTQIDKRSHYQSEFRRSSSVERVQFENQNLKDNVNLGRNKGEFKTQAMEIGKQQTNPSKAVSPPQSRLELGFAKQTDRIDKITNRHITKIQRVEKINQPEGFRLQGKGDYQTVNGFMYHWITPQPDSST